MTAACRFTRSWPTSSKRAGLHAHCFVITDFIGQPRLSRRGADPRARCARPRHRHSLGVASRAIQRAEPRGHAPRVDREPPAARRHARSRGDDGIGAWRIFLESRRPRSGRSRDCSCCSTRSRFDRRVRSTGARSPDASRFAAARPPISREGSCIARRGRVRREWAAWNAKGLVKPLLGSSYPRVADWIYGGAR